MHLMACILSYLVRVLRKGELSFQKQKIKVAAFNLNLLLNFQPKKGDERSKK